MTRLHDVRASTTAGAARLATASPRLGQIGPWELTRLVVDGELSRVYQARPAGAGDDRPADYALKVLQAAWHERPEAVACMRREALVGRSVASAHLISILAAHTTEPPYFVVMPWLTGATLAARLRSGWRPRLPSALWIVRQTAAALEALDAAGFLHADIKPENIFLSPRMHVTVLDLGFARRTDEAGSAADRCLLGTPHYLAPELITSAYGADIRSDIYSLGVTLFELLTGRPPFEGRDLGEIVRQHCQSRPANLRRWLPQVPREVSQLVYDMLAKQPLRRPQTPRELIDRLVRLEIATLGEF